MSHYDHYTEAKAIAGQIEIAGFATEASAIREAIDAGSSGTEIFMQLRFYLAPLRTNAMIDSAARVQIAVLIDKINDALER